MWMSYCTKCGLPVGANDRFCSKCGQPVNSAPSLSSISDEKSKTLLSIGALSGVGASLLLAGLFIAAALNNIYNQQNSYLAQSNMQVDFYAFGLDDMVFLIAFGVLLAIFGAYALILGVLGQFSSKARIAIGLKDGYASVGNGFLNAGILTAAIFSANLIRNLYRPTSSSWYEPVLFAFIIGGLIALTLGAFLVRYAYRRSLQLTAGA
jgi:hypothetical protein